MVKKRALLLVVLLTLSLVPFAFFVSPAECATMPSSLQWAVLIGASDYFGTKDRMETLRDTYYMYHVLKEKFRLSDDRIIYMFVNPSRATALNLLYSKIPEDIIDVEPSSVSVINQQFTELGTKTSYSDNILIYFSGHGAGWHETKGWVGGRWEPNTGDEGSEIWNSTSQSFVGCDEGLLVQRWYEGEKVVVKYNFTYFDDDLKSDIQKLKYNRLVLVLDCCFAGGFIDDLSNPKHTIICAAKETVYASGDEEDSTFEGFGEFTGYFLDALHGCHTTWNQSEYAQYNRLIHGETVNADLDGDGKVTWKEAFKYAVAHHDFSSEVCPWFDDDGNGYPTFKDGRSILDYTLTIKATWGGTTTPAPGEHVYLEETLVSLTAVPNSGYNFVHWVTDDELWTIWRGLGYWYAENPYTIAMNADRSIVACFEPVGGAGGGGSDPCPTLLVWNGNAYVDYGVINIHNPSGEDVVKEVTVQAGDVGITNYKAKFRLREGWEGLTYSHSEIDQVKLYAIDSYGNHLPCPLTKATYINQYDVWLPLLVSDDNKWDIYLLDTIDLEFFVPYRNIQGFTFTIEGCNMMKE